MMCLLSCKKTQLLQAFILSIVKTQNDCNLRKHPLSHHPSYKFLGTHCIISNTAI